ncbi:LamG domain-containing protein [Streptomyces sp. NPDC003996]
MLRTVRAEREPGYGPRRRIVCRPTPLGDNALLVEEPIPLAREAGADCRRRRFWTHLAATYEAPVAGDSGTGTMSLYQDGTLMGTAKNLSPQYDSSLPLTIGGCVNSASAPTPYLAFPGSVADVHVYPRTLSATEVGALR